MDFVGIKQRIDGVKAHDDEVKQPFDFEWCCGYITGLQEVDVIDQSKADLLYVYVASLTPESQTPAIMSPIERSLKLIKGNKDPNEPIEGKKMLSWYEPKVIGEDV